MDAETAYVFRHALLREVAMQLQPPTERAALHGTAFSILEAHYGAAGDPAVLDAGAAELAHHARMACGADSALPADTLEHLARKELYFAVRAATAAQRAFHHAEVMAWGRRVAEHPLATPAQAAAALLDAAAACSRTARLSEATDLQQQAMKTARQHGMQAEIARAARELAVSMFAAGRNGDGQRLMAEALEAARAAGDDDVLGATLLACARGDDTPGTEALLAEADALMARTGNLAGRAGILSTLASREHDRTGDTTRCVGLQGSALELARRAGAREQEASILVNTGVAYANASMAEDAEKTYRQALQLATAIGNRRYRAVLLHNLAQLERFFHGRPLPAVQLYEEAANEFREMEQTGEELDRRLAVTNLLANIGAFDRAEAHVARAAEIAQLAANDEWAARADRSLASLRLAQERYAEAAAAARRSLRTCTAGIPTGGAASASYDVLAAVAWQEGRLQEAMDFVTASLADFTLEPPQTTAWAVRLNRLGYRLLQGDATGALEDLAGVRTSFGPSGEAGLPLAHVFLRVLRPQVALCLAEAGEFTRAMAPPLVARMREVLAGGELSQYPARRRILERAEAALDELDRARAEGRPPRLFRGVMPETLPPLLRLALLESLKELQPEQHRRMQAENPALLKAMRQGTEGLAVPDWRSSAALGPP